MGITLNSTTSRPKSVPPGGMSALAGVGTITPADNQPLAPLGSKVRQQPLDNRQAEHKNDPQNPPASRTRTTLTGQIKKEEEIPSNPTPIDNNNPPAKTDPSPGVDVVAHLHSLRNISDAVKHPSNGKEKIPQQLANAAKLAGAKIKKNIYGQPIGIEYRIRGMGKLKMRIDERGEITSSVTSLNSAANPREMTSIFLQKLQKNIPQTDVDGTSANLSGLSVNLTTGEVSFNGESIASFPMPGEDVVSYTFDKQGNFNPNMEALAKDPSSFASQMQRAMGRLHGGSGSALNSISDETKQMTLNKQQFKLSPFTVRNACKEVSVKYEALDGLADKIKEHVREPDVLLTTFSRHLQEANDLGTPEDQLVQKAIDSTIQQYQTLTGDNLSEKNMTYTKAFLTALNLDKNEKYAIEGIEKKDMSNTVVSAEYAVAATEMNFEDFSQQLDSGNIPLINNQACPALMEYAKEINANNLRDHRDNPSPVIRNMEEGFKQQGITKEDENKFNAFKASESDTFKNAGFSFLNTCATFEFDCEAAVSSQDQDIQLIQNTLLRAAWLVGSNSNVSKENAPYLIVGALKDRPEFRGVSLPDLKNLAEKAIKLRDEMTSLNTLNSLKNPDFCKMLAVKTGQPIAVKKFDNDNNCIGATLYLPENKHDKAFNPVVELEYNNKTNKFFEEKNPDNDLYNQAINDKALKFDLKAGEIKLSGPNPTGDGA